MATWADSTLAPRAQTVHRLAEKLGFALLGIAPAEASPHAEHIRQWIASGAHGEMHYLAEQLEQRLDPRVLVPGARSVICVADLYDGREEMGSARGCEAASGGNDKSQIPNPKSPIPLGRIARYAW